MIGSQQITRREQIDFVKIDVQPAEQDIVAGRTQSPANLSRIVSEVEFIPRYIGQPLMGALCRFYPSAE